MDKIRKSRNRWLAAFLSLITAGLGQLYCGEHKRAILFICTYAIGTGIFVGLSFLADSILWAALFGISGVLFQVFCAVDAWLIASRVGAIEIQQYNRWYIYAGIIIGIALVWNSVMGVRETTWKAYFSAYSGMNPTLIAGDKYFARMREYVFDLPPKGRVIIFQNQNKPDQDWVKRLIGIPGDKVQILRGELYIDGARVDRQVDQKMDNNDIRYKQMLPGESSFLIVEKSDDGKFDNTDVFSVPKGHVFVLGDNRDNSLDSRHPNLGFVPIKNIKGVVDTIYWSNDLNRIGMRVE